MSFAARYRGMCADCDEPISVGDEVEYDETGALVHVKCPEAIPELTGQRCPRCFAHHPGEC